MKRLPPLGTECADRFFCTESSEKFVAIRTSKFHVNMTFFVETY